MEVDTTSDDYWPFPSKEFTLLYFLLNSPRPLVYDYVFMRTYNFSSNEIFFTPVGTIKFEVHVARHEAVEFINSKLESGQEFLASWIEPASEGKVHLLHSVSTSKKQLEYMICSCNFLPFNNQQSVL